MKAIVYTQHGSPDVLCLKEVEKPIPKEDELLIRVQAASLNALDSHMMRGLPFVSGIMDKLAKPEAIIPGADLAGRVESIGRAVTKFKVGDEVFGSGRGTLAEYVCSSENKVVLKPATITFEEAAAVPVAALTALQGLRDFGKIQQGQKVLIYGAGGGVGTFAVQIAKSFDTEVTAVCSTRNLGMARAIGADYVIDYTKDDFIRMKQRYDLIMAINGYHPILTYKRVLNPNGVFIVAGASKKHLIKVILQGMLLGPVISMIGKQKMRFVNAKMRPEDLIFVKTLMEAGSVKSVIDRRYQFSEVAEAVRYLEEGHSQGKIVITDIG